MVQFHGDTSCYGDGEAMHSLVDVGEVGKYLGVRVCSGIASDGQSTCGGAEL